MDNIPVKKQPNQPQPASPKTETKYYVNNNPFYSFRFSSKSMTFDGSKTYIQSKEARFENGKFDSQEFEGVMDGNVYMKAVADMQNLMIQHMNSFVKQVSSFFNIRSFFPMLSSRDYEKDK